jgi:hypothetical protein
MPLGVRLGLTAAAAALLLAAGVAVPERLGAAGRRLRAVLWLLSAGAFAGFLALIGAEALDWQNGEDVTVFVGGGTAAYAGALYARHRSVLQQAALFVALVTTAAAGAAHLEGGEVTAPGLTVWGLGLVWLALAWGGLLPPRRAAYVLGSIGALLGAQMTMTTGWGHFVALGTVAALIGAAVLVGDLVVLGIGAVGALMILPGTMAYYFPGALAAPLALLAAGVLLVAAALRTARRRGQPRMRTGRDYASGARNRSLAVAGGIGLVVTVAVLVVGLS